jgi:predicted transcriptional regulator
MIACEQNYGSRLASILNLSAPAIHRHLKFLSQEMKDDNMKNFSFIKPSYTTSESYSGYKGAEATIYEIGTKIYFSFVLYPNFIQSHAFLVDSNSNLTNQTDKIVESPVERNSETSQHPEKGTEEVKEFSTIFEQVQKKNDKIRELEKQIIEILEEKNSLMQKIDKSILKQPTLSFDERVSLRLLACQGPICIPNLPELLKQDVEITTKNLNSLKQRGWFHKFESQIQAGLDIALKSLKQK